MSKHRLVLPGIFWRDHHERCGDEGECAVIGSDQGRTVIVELDDEALDNLRSDAWYYSPPGAPDGMEGWGRPIIRSAQATERALVRQGLELYRPRTAR